jgi:hypothetical protein
MVAVFIATAWAAEAPLQLKNNVQGNSSAAYYGLQVPLWLREQAASAELSDLRVLNARGDELPYAWHVSGLQSTTQQRRPANMVSPRIPIEKLEWQLHGLRHKTRPSPTGDALLRPRSSST